MGVPDIYRNFWGIYYTLGGFRSIKETPRYPREFQYSLYFYSIICELLGGSKFFWKALRQSKRL
jgi:hypothetical protein